MVNIKDWAKKKGISESDIEYDPATKKIKVKGVDYGKGTPTYTTQMQAVRPSDMTTYYKPARVQSGTKFDEEVLDDTFNRGNLAEAQRRQQTMQNQYMNTLTQGYKPGVFKYDQAKDPAYQLATADYQRRLNDMLRANMENASARGMYRSRSTSDSANQLVADETRRFNTEIAPQLEERAYNRYVQSEGMNRNKWQDDVQRLAAALGITKENTANMQGIVDRSAQQRQGIADALSKMYGTSVRATVDTDAMYNQVRGMKTAAEREAEAKRQALIEEREFKAQEAEKDRDFRAGQNRLDRASRASSGGSAGGVSTVNTPDMINDKKLSTIIDTIGNSGFVVRNTKVTNEVPGDLLSPEIRTSTQTVKDANARQAIKNIIDNSSANEVEKKFLYQYYQIPKSSITVGQANTVLKHAKNAPKFTGDANTITNNIVNYVDQFDATDAQKEMLYVQLMKKYKLQP